MSSNSKWMRTWMSSTTSQVTRSHCTLATKKGRRLRTCIMHRMITLTLGRITSRSFKAERTASFKILLHGGTVCCFKTTVCNSVILPTSRMTTHSSWQDPKTQMTTIGTIPRNLGQASSRGSHKATQRKAKGKLGQTRSSTRSFKICTLSSLATSSQESMSWERSKAFVKSQTSSRRVHMIATALHWTPNDSMTKLSRWICTPIDELISLTS